MLEHGNSKVLAHLFTALFIVISNNKLRND